MEKTNKRARAEKTIEIVSHDNTYHAVNCILGDAGFLGLRHGGSSHRQVKYQFADEWQFTVEHVSTASTQDGVAGLLEYHCDDIGPEVEVYGPIVPRGTTLIQCELGCIPWKRRAPVVLVIDVARVYVKANVELVEQFQGHGGEGPLAYILITGGEEYYQDSYRAAARRGDERTSKVEWRKGVVDKLMCQLSSLEMLPPIFFHGWEDDLFRAALGLE